MKFTLHNIYHLSGGAGDELFDLNKLPFPLTENVQIEDVSSRFRQDAFDLWREHIGIDRWKVLKRIRYALVHRYDSGPTFNEETKRFTSETEITQQSENLVRSLVACLRLIRPMRQSVSLIHGDIREDGSFDARGFETPPEDFIEVPEAHKLFALRNRDADDLRAYAPEFLRAMRGHFWKFRMAIQFHERGYFLPQDWKARYILWCAAIEAIYTTHNREHKGSHVAKARINWFLGENAPLYEQEHHWDNHSTLTIGQVVDNLYEQRNYIAHGDKIPDEFFNHAERSGIAGPVLRPEMLTEAVSFVVRKSLLKILKNNLLRHFADAGSAEAYFAAQNLTNSALRAPQGKHQARQP